ncbi:succinate-semialdehyde dehydrogenase I [Gammaproteobacteria bacterium]|nr:succinate-semialdehyde dehydrogenase I [Gammaproteobacteria bacterium]
MNNTVVNAALAAKLSNPDLLKNQAFINGKWQHTSRTFAVLNPASSTLITDVAECGEKETEQAITAASNAFLSFKKLTGKERSVFLKRMGELMLIHQKDLAIILTTEQGKPLAESMGEVVYAASFLEWFGEEAKRVYGDIIPSHKAGSKILVSKEPVGVVAAITPWNFPLAMFTRKMGAALAAGCTVVWKPASETPLSANALGVIAQLALLPEGVLNIVAGRSAAAIGSAFMASSKVRKITFTGSTATGKLLMQQAAATMKKVSMELGGNAPFIVFNDANLDEAIIGAMASKFRNTGQTCVCVNRFYIQEGIYDVFTKKLADAINALKVADGFTEGASQGPLINQDAFDKVVRHVKDAVDKGGSVICGGKPSSLGGLFYEPTLILNANTKMSLATEETFGPVAACFKFKTEEEVITLANDTEFGLSAYFYSNDLGRVFRVADALETGMIGVNDGIISTEIAPFGGVKESGMGREGSKYGVDDYLNIKYVLLGGLSNSSN